MGVEETLTKERGRRPGAVSEATFWRGLHLLERSATHFRKCNAPGDVLYCDVNPVSRGDRTVGERRDFYPSIQPDGDCNKTKESI